MIIPKPAQKGGREAPPKVSKEKDNLMALEITVTRTGSEPKAVSAEILENLSVVLPTEKPATRDAYDAESGAGETPSLKAARFIRAKFGAIISKDDARRADVFTGKLDKTTGNNAKSGWSFTLSREAILAYCEALILWAEAAPGNPGLTYDRADGKRSPVVTTDGETADNE